MQVQVSLSVAAKGSSPAGGRLVIKSLGKLSAMKTIKNAVEGGVFKHDPFSHSIMVQLAKTGAHKGIELQRAFQAFYSKASASEKEAFFPEKETKALLAELIMQVAFERRSSSFAMRVARGAGTQPIKLYPVDASRTVLTTVILLYAYVARKLCGILKTPFKPSIVNYMLTNKQATSVPLQIKKVISNTAAKTAVADTRGIEELKLKDFKTYNADLALRLPGMFATFIKENKQKTKIKKTTYRGPGGTRRTYVDRTGTALNKLQAKNAAVELLKDEVGPELFAFYSHVIPALNTIMLRGKAPETKKALYEARMGRDLPEYKAMMDASDKLAKISRGAYGRSFSRPGTRKMTPLRKQMIADAKKEYAASKKALVAARKASKESKITTHVATMKKWMVPYLGQHNDISRVRGAAKIVDPALLSHRLVMKANSGRVKSGAVELNAIINESDALTLSYKGVGTILDAVGSSIDAAKTIFSDTLSILKAKMFVVGVSDEQGSGLTTDLGRVTNARLLRLNNITKDDADAVLKQFATEFKAWNPLKTDLEDVAKSLNKTVKAQAGKMSAVKCSDKQAKQYHEDLQQFKSNLHNVGIRVVTAWDVTPSKKSLTALKNLKKAGSDKVQVIRNVFHGCARETGSIILHAGFKITGTEVTARSMGDVLYIAPCIDKSAQYLGATFGRTAGTQGIIFMGDILISGDPTSVQGGSRNNTNSLQWTKTSRFATEEIGLVDPNMQFLIKHAFLIEVNRDVGKKTALATQMKTFEKPIPITSYSLT